MLQSFIAELPQYKPETADQEGVIRALQEFLVIKTDPHQWVNNLQQVIPIFKQFANDQLVSSSSEMLSLLLTGWTDRRVELIE